MRVYLVFLAIGSVLGANGQLPSFFETFPSFYGAEKNLIISSYRIPVVYTTRDIPRTVSSFCACYTQCNVHPNCTAATVVEDGELLMCNTFDFTQTDPRDLLLENVTRSMTYIKRGIDQRFWPSDNGIYYKVMPTGDCSADGGTIVIIKTIEVFKMIKKLIVKYEMGLQPPSPPGMVEQEYLIGLNRHSESPTDLGTWVDGTHFNETELPPHMIHIRDEEELKFAVKGPLLTSVDDVAASSLPFICQYNYFGIEE